MSFFYFFSLNAINLIYEQAIYEQRLETDSTDLPRFLPGLLCLEHPVYPEENIQKEKKTG